MVGSGLVVNEEQWRKYHLFDEYFKEEYDSSIGDTEAWGLVEDYIEALDPGHDRQGLFLFGPPGAGKTLMAHLVMTKVMERRNARYFSMKLDCISAVGYMNLLQEMMTTADMVRSGVDLGDDYIRMHSRLTGVQKARWLLLDDLATEHTTDWSRNRISTLIRERGNAGHPTVMTTNLYPDAFSKAYGERTLSYVHQVCRVVEVTGADIRRL